jgi:hypothetical protein
VSEATEGTVAIVVTAIGCAAAGRSRNGRLAAVHGSSRPDGGTARRPAARLCAAGRLGPEYESARSPRSRSARCTSGARKATRRRDDVLRVIAEQPRITVTGVGRELSVDPTGATASSAPSMPRACSPGSGRSSA